MLDTRDLFNEGFYLAKNPDVAGAVATGAIASALDHFRTFGEVERRDPSAFFDTSYYLNKNPDVAAAVARLDTTAFEHFLESGQKEGRIPTPVFDINWYGLKNPDVVAAVDRGAIAGSFKHYVEFGAREQRSASPVFDPQYYLLLNWDVGEAVQRDEITGIEHFVAFGAREGRNPSPLFDSSFYLATNPDVAAAVSNGIFASGAEHFLEFGRKEGRSGVIRNFLPTPIGQFQISKTFYQFNDPSRPEIFTPDPNDTRSVQVQVWFPAQFPPGTAEPAIFPPFRQPYLNPVVGGAIAPVQGLPPNFYNLIGTNSLPSSAVVSSSQASYPVILFSHGLGALPEAYTTQLENLASQGYIVAAINHPYVSALTVFSDGRVAPFASNFVPSNPTELEAGLVQAIGVTAADASFVLTQLSGLNANDPNRLLTGKMDLNRAGIFGHSFGGITATVAMQQDKRFQAGLSEDGLILSDKLLQTPIDRPFMLINAAQTFNNSPLGQVLSNADRQLRPQVYNRLTGPGYNLTVPGTAHADFSDRSLLFPLLAAYSPDQLGRGRGFDLGLTDISALDGRGLEQIIPYYIGSFFDRYLKNYSFTFGSLLAGRFPDPRVEFQSRNAVIGADNPNFPTTVGNAVLQTVFQQFGEPITNQNLISAEKWEWPDGCLGLGGPGVVCTQAIVPGWQVIVSKGAEELTYRTNESGSQVVLESRIQPSAPLP